MIVGCKFFLITFLALVSKVPYSLNVLMTYILLKEELLTLLHTHQFYTKAEFLNRPQGQKYHYYFTTKLKMTL